LNEVVEVERDLVQYDEDGNALMVFDGGVHIVTNGDFLITSKGEVSILSETALSLDCALLLLNCRLSRQLREMKHELRLMYIDMLGGMPDLTDEQKHYLKITKNKAVDLLSLPVEEVSHLEEEIE
jgi:hypothetical protein